MIAYQIDGNWYGEEVVWKRSGSGTYREISRIDVPQSREEITAFALENSYVIEWRMRDPPANPDTASSDSRVAPAAVSPDLRSADPEASSSNRRVPGPPQIESEGDFVWANSSIVVSANSSIVVSANSSIVGSAKIKCRLCKEEIERGAAICTHCKSYQSRVRNLISQGSVFIAVLSFLASCGLYGYSHVMQIITDRALDRISIHSFDSGGPSNYLNLGPRRAFLLRAEIQPHDKIFKVKNIINIMMNVDSGQLLTVGEESRYYVPRFQSDAQWQRFKTANHEGKLAILQQTEVGRSVPMENLRMAFWSMDNPKHKLFREGVEGDEARKLRTVEVTITVYYLSDKSNGEKSVSVSGEGVFIVTPKAK